MFSLSRWWHTLLMLIVHVARTVLPNYPSRALYQLQFGFEPWVFFKPADFLAKRHLCDTFDSSRCSLKGSCRSHQRVLCKADSHGTGKRWSKNIFFLIMTTTLVYVFSSPSFWTSSSLDVPAGVTQEEGHTAFFIHLPSAVRALVFLARRIQPFLSLVDLEDEFLCTNDLIVPHSLGIYVSEGYEVTSELPGRPVQKRFQSTYFRRNRMRKSN